MLGDEAAWAAAHVDEDWNISQWAPTVWPRPSARRGFSTCRPPARFSGYFSRLTKVHGLKPSVSGIRQEALRGHRRTSQSRSAALNTQQPGALPPGLKAGQIVDAKVLQALANGQIQLSLANTLMTVESQVPLMPGTLGAARGQPGCVGRPQAGLGAGCAGRRSAEPAGAAGAGRYRLRGGRRQCTGRVSQGPGDTEPVCLDESHPAGTPTPAAALADAGEDRRDPSGQAWHH